MKYRKTDTPGFKKLWEDSIGRDRSPDKEFIDRLDPEGVHIVVRSSPVRSDGVGSFIEAMTGVANTLGGSIHVHPDVQSRAEIRVEWYVKLIGKDEPTEVDMDNSSGAFNKWTVEAEDWKTEGVKEEAK